MLHDVRRDSVEAFRAPSGVFRFVVNEANNSGPLHPFRRNSIVIRDAVAFSNKRECAAFHTILVFVVTFNLYLIESYEPHEASNAFTTTVRFVSSICCFKSAEIFWCKPNTVVFDHKTRHISVRCVLQQRLLVVVTYN